MNEESTGNLYLWNRWGRVGVPGQNNMTGPLAKAQAISAYQKKHKDKTVSGGYKELEINYDAEEEEEEKPTSGTKKKETASKMESTLQNFIRLIFDKDLMSRTMKELGYDVKKMPLGKLGEGTIKEANLVLT